MQNNELRFLYELAEFHRLETSFWDGLGNFRTAPPEAVIAVLNSLGISIDSPKQALSVLEENRSGWNGKHMEPVIVLWENLPHRLEILTHDWDSSGAVKLEITLETGEVKQFDVFPETEPENESTSRTVFLPLPEKIPFGYHSYKAGFSDLEREGNLFSSPSRAYQPSATKRSWGTFIPIYSLHSDRSAGAADLTDFLAYARWIRSAGGEFVGTLPLYSAFLDTPCEPSPYSPLSRLFWNEFYVDFELAPNWTSCQPARDLYQSTEFQSEVEKLRNQERVNYRHQWTLKKKILRILSRNFFESGGGSHPDFESFLHRNSEVEQYARFRAVLDERENTWKSWPAELRSGNIPEGSYLETDRDFFLFTQWMADDQINRLKKTFTDEGIGLYMDLPLGTHPDGFDCWYEPEWFANQVTGGAPPDSFFTEGQNWGFQPLHPEKVRQQGHLYFRQILEKMTSCSNMVRIDHAMSLQRLYWIPEGFQATEGLYVHYPTEELFAILNIESMRQECPLVGEDLGTVTPEIRDRLDKHGILRMYVGQFECAMDSNPPFKEPGRSFVASLNTHDTPTAAAFWAGLDIDLRREMGLIEEADYDREHISRSELKARFLQYFEIDPEAAEDEKVQMIIRNWYLALAKSTSCFVLVNLEDLWLEKAPQNIPGTGHERPNWQRKSAYSIGDLATSPGVSLFLQSLDSARKGKENEGPIQD
jgi:4-alpha-glucanotransferase